ncbi:putative arginine--tRNA ligase, cytoplasmic [Choanephora cucurbitarum]|uniref:arginine--tRNA ligase n=1 Tax=Choanephora cucurbitarum TaxID=101091 RepID=A0A1C7NPU6_9FUNG|nr:putative arginine--tRNA ligase, cytoplasmic [Choanephora cucurbitarum]
MTALLRFKQAIAKQLSDHTACSPQKIVSFMRTPKQLKEAHVDIAMPKLNASLASPRDQTSLLPWTHELANKASFTYLSKKNFGRKESYFETNEYIEQVKAQGTKLTFRFRDSEFTRQVLQQTYQEDTAYGWSHIPKPKEDKKTIVIDYSSPNIAKPFHAGHLRSTILGNFVQKIHEAIGYRVVGINYLGDWGKQYVVKGLLAVGFNKYGDKEKLKSDPIHHLYEVYVKINAEAKVDSSIDKLANDYFKRMEQGDPDTIEQWKQFRDLSIESYSDIYKRLNIQFDAYSGESQVNPYLPKVHSLLGQKQLLNPTSDGALAVDLGHEDSDKVVVQRADGTSLYVTRDLASILMRKEKYAFDRGIYVVGSEQANYFKQLFHVTRLMLSDPSIDLKHVEFGRIKGMSTRNGTVVFLQDMLDTAKEKILDYMKADEKKSQIDNLEWIADQLGISAILIQDMKSKRCKDYEFSWDRMTDARGDTGVFLQYAHARSCSIERNANVQVTSDCDFSILKEKEAIELVHSIASFPDIVDTAFSTLEPCTIVNYLFKLSHATSQASNALRVKDMTPEISKARMLLFWSARITLRNGLHLLGIQPIHRM